MSRPRKHIMKMTQKLVLAAGLAAVLTLSACGGNDDPGPVVAPVPTPPVVVPPVVVPPVVVPPVVVPPVVVPPVVITVPDSAGVSVASFITYLLSLASNDETSEPAVINDLFAVPADETSEPQVLI